ncbi:hypothetical protein [Sulfidibacter corallicola]|uniref:USP domain-containing protein n=1 Tax=Sulfidibacter corallicola TaxID=2818388 RepID=A0A8A4TJU4_SULCO|nr:hypothetical protein [Sulfidibacter corallicola]QTD49422.1 hypothetical protein J3U87_27875 [Sulfidibacter corallicola]
MTTTQYRTAAQTGAQRIVASGHQLKAGDQPRDIGNWLGKNISTSLAKLYNSAEAAIWSQSTYDKIRTENRNTVADFQEALKTDYGTAIALRLTQDFNLDQMIRDQASLGSTTVTQVLARADTLLHQEMTGVPPFVEAGVLPHADLDHIKQKYGSDVVEALLATPFMQEKLAEGIPLSEEQSIDLSLAASKLAAMRAHDPSLESLEALSHQAQNLLGETYDFSNLESAITILKDLGQNLAELPNRTRRTNPFAQFEPVASGDPHRVEKEYEVYEQLLTTTNTLLAQSKKTLPGFHREVLKGVAAELKTAIRGRVVKDLMAEIHGKMSDMARSGGTRKVEGSFTIGAGATVFGVPVATAKAGLKLNYTLQTGDDLKVRESETASLSLSLSAGKKNVAQVGAGAAASIGKGKTYRSLEDYVRHQADALLNINLPQASPAGHQKLQMQLKTLGIINNGDRLNLDRDVPPDFVRTRAKSGEGKLSFQILRFLNTTSAAQKKTTFTKNLTMTQAMNQQPDLVKTATKEHFALTWKGEHFGKETGHAKFGEIEAKLTNILGRPDSLDKTQKLAFLRADLKDAMHHLEGEFDHFSLASNTKATNREERSAIKAALTELKGHRGAKNKEAYLEAVVHTFTRLSQLYQATFPDEASTDGADPGFDKSMETFAKKLMEPPFKINPKNLPSHQRVMQGETKTISNTFEVDLGLGKASAKIQYDNVTNDSNPDNDGDYLTVSVSVTAGTNLKSVLTAMENSEGFKGFFEAMWSRKDGQEGGFDTEQPVISLSEVEPIGVDMGASGRVTVSLRFGKQEDQSYSMHFLRVSGETAKGFDTEVGVDVMPGGGITLGVGYQEETSRNLTERLGTNTLNHVQKQFNGMKAGGQFEQGTWGKFVTAHRNQFGTMFSNLANPNSKISKEVAAKFRALGQDPVPTDFTEAMNQFKADKKNEVAFNKAKDALTHLLTQQYEKPYTEEVTRRFGVVHRRKATGLKAMLNPNRLRRLFARPKKNLEPVRHRASTVSSFGSIDLQTAGEVRNTGIPNASQHHQFLTSALNVIAGAPAYRELFTEAHVASLQNSITTKGLDFAEAQKLATAMRTLVTPGSDGDKTQAMTHAIEAMTALNLIGQEEQEAAEPLQNASNLLFDKLLPLFDPEGSTKVGLFTTTRYNLNQMQPFTPGGQEQLQDLGEDSIHTEQTRTHVLDLPIANVANLQEALDRFQGAQKMDDATAVVGGQPKRGEATRTTKPFGAPPVLNFRLHRDSAVEDKATHPVDIPDTIQFGGETYHLRTAVLHHGKDAKTDDFTTLRHDNDGWTHHNGQEVTPVVDPNEGTNKRALDKGLVFTYVRD